MLARRGGNFGRIYPQFSYARSLRLKFSRTYLWLNEGFARFVEHIGVNLVYPDWQMIDYFLVRTLQNVFQSDASAGTRPMSLYVEHPNDIDRQFSNIAYDKGTKRRIC